MPKQRFAFFVAGLVSLAGAVFCGTEVFLSFIGHSLCHAESCNIVENFSIFSRLGLSAIAAIYFLFQSVASFCVWQKREVFLTPLIFISAVAIGTEAILMGRQFIDYHLYCHFCLTVAAFIILSSGLILVVSKRFVVFGVIFGVIFALMLTPLSIQSLSQAATQHILRGSPTEKWILIYAPECSHCRKVLSFCQNLKNVDLRLCPRDKAIFFLHIMGIKGVPVLLVYRDGEKRIFVGSNLILNYLKSQERGPLFPELIPPEGICEENRKCEPLDEELF